MDVQWARSQRDGMESALLDTWIHGFMRDLHPCQWSLPLPLAMAGTKTC